MNKIFILSLITLSVAFACHSSCFCEKDSNVCKSCKYANIGSKVDANKRYCACPPGYYSEKYLAYPNNPNGPIDNPDENSCVYYLITQEYAFHYDRIEGYSSLSQAGAQSNCDDTVQCEGIYLINQTWYMFSGAYADSQGSLATAYKKDYCSPPQYHSPSHLPFECHEFVNFHQGNDVSVEMEACKLEIGLKTKDMKVLTDCHFENIDGKSYVVSVVRLDVTNSVFNSVCLSSIRTKLEYKSPANSKYIDLPSIYIIDKPSGNKTIKIPLINIFDMATTQTVDENQIVQVVNLKLFIGHEDAYVRSHKWDLIVYTNRDQVEVFQIDVDIQETEGCQPGQECIVIADLDTVSHVYTDSTFNNIHNPPHQYNVGDIFYAKIKFADPTYKKQLTFVKLYFKTDQNKIFNFSSITTASWDGDGLRISLILVQPSQGAVIQVNMKISTSNARFLVGSEEEQTVQSKFQVTITDNQISSSANQNQDNNDKTSENILFGMTFLSLLFLLF